ncbi:MAG TPA: TolC family protein [Methylophilaceae bacterium]|nr:TolC family protein [Methylophilaceae bacterium]
MFNDTGYAGMRRMPSPLRWLVGAGLSLCMVSALAAPSGWGKTVEPATPLSLQSAVELALSANPEASAASLEVDAFDGAILQAQARPNPEIAALMEDTRSATRITTLQINQAIELGGKRAARVEAASKSRDVATVELASKRAEIRAGVVTAFFEVLIAQERRQLARSLAELAQRASGAAQRRVLAGRVSPVEETKANVAEANIRIELMQAESELASARKRLAAIWGNPTPQFERALGDIESLPALPELTDFQARLASAPLMQRARAEIERRQALAELERSRAVPDVTVSIGARRNEELGLNQAILGVSIPLPVFDRNQGNLLEAMRRTDKARDELVATEFQLSGELAQTHQRLASARSEVETLRQDILPGAQGAFDASARGFELGKFSFLDVLDAQRTLFQAKSQYLRALSEAHRAAAGMERLLGAADATATPVDNQQQ